LLNQGRQSKKLTQHEGREITFLCEIAECFTCLSQGLGICCDCIKMVQARITKSSPWDAPRTSLSWQIFVSLGEGIPVGQGRQRRALPIKRCYFAVIGSYSVKTVADRYRHAAYHNKHWWQAF